jgi:hypothetical protein
MDHAITATMLTAIAITSPSNPNAATAITKPAMSITEKSVA